MSFILNALDQLDPVNFVRTRLGFEPDPHQEKVLSEDIRRGILNCCRQWGKSTITAAKAVHHAYSYPESLTLVLSPSARQSAEFLRKATGFLDRLGIKARGDGDNELSILLPNNSRLVGLPSREATIRGFSAVSLLLIDEASRVPDELYRAVRPMLAVAKPGRPDPQLWLLSTPNGRNGFFHDTWFNLDPSWTRISVPADQCPRISKSYLDDEERTLGDSFYRQEYLCQFIDDQLCFFADLDLESFLDDTVEPLFPEYE